MSKVSVIIPAYNAAAFVARAIDSALHQTEPPLEILVIDDGSSDETAEVVAAYPAPVRLLKKANGGPASARNLGARLARGEWLAMLDADDWWAPRKLECQLALATVPDIGLIHGPATTSRLNVPSELTFDDLWEQNWIINSSALICRSVFESAGGFNEDRNLISTEDYNLWLHIAAAGWRIVTCKDADALTFYSRGIGISSNIERFLAASLYNCDTIGRKFELTPAKIREKRVQIYQSAGVAALYERRMALARQLLRRSFVMAPSGSQALHLAAAYTPSSVLNLRRRLLTASDDGANTSRRTSPGAAHDEASIFGGPNIRQVDFSAEKPTVLIVIDAEEAFDWNVLPYRSSNVTSMRRQELAQRIISRYGIVPTYAVDYAVASQPDGYLPLLPLVEDGACEIGAQLHPWVTPPITEEMIERNTYAGNLSPVLEFEKLKVLTETIVENFGRQPILYRAGRYGTGQQTARSLLRLGYKVDCSVVPLFDFRWKFGPDFRHSPTDPYWCGPNQHLLEIPVTAGMTGLLAKSGKSLHHLMFTRPSEKMHIPGLLAHLRLLDRIRLSPEGTSLEEAKRLTRTLIQRDGRRLFVLSYHSPSLEPGNTPYVRTQADLKAFLHWIEAYLDFFLGEIGGTASTPGEVFNWARQTSLSKEHALLQEAFP